MEILIATSLVATIGVTAFSSWAIKRASQRPANGEVKTLIRLDQKLLKQVNTLNHSLVISHNYGK